jgi:hypothetical protein
MIKRPTVFVLGAGASHGYGFPLGARLVKNIIEGVAPGGPLFTQLERILDAGQMSNVADFRRDLIDSQRSSIDRFLQTRREFLEVGKTTIAVALIPCESDETLRAARDSG